MSKSAAGGRSSGFEYCIHLAKVEWPMLKSFATYLSVKPLVNAICTASRLNFLLCLVAMFLLLDG